MNNQQGFYKNIIMWEYEGVEVQEKDKNHRVRTINQQMGGCITVIGDEAFGVAELIQGVCLIDDKLVVVLFDSGARHSFISTTYVDFLKLEVVDLDKKLTISTDEKGW